MCGQRHLHLTLTTCGTTCGNNRLCLDSPSVSLRVSLGWQLPQLLQLQEHLWFSDPAVALTSLPADSLLMTINLFGFGFDSCIPWPTILFALHYACPTQKCYMLLKSSQWTLASMAKCSKLCCALPYEFKDKGGNRGGERKGSPSVLLSQILYLSVVLLKTILHSILSKFFLVQKKKG